MPLSQAYSGFVVAETNEQEETLEYCASNEQCVYRFPNNYGASVVRRTHQMKLFPGPVTGTYGADKGLWELAVIRFQEDGQWEITYKTKITCDVLGWLSEAEVDEVLGKIRKLRKLRTKPVPKEEPAPALEPEKFNNLLDWFQTEPADMMGIANTGLRDSQRK